MASSLVCDRIRIAGALFKHGSLLNSIKKFSVLDKNAVKWSVQVAQTW